jgi:tetratricopeptide (TPR) repeat protein
MRPISEHRRDGGQGVAVEEIRQGEPAMYAALASLAIMATGAEPFDKGALRSAIHLPVPSGEFGGVYSTTGDIEIDWVAYLPEETGVAERATRSSPKDPDRYRDLAKLYFGAGEQAKAKAAEARAAELYRQCLTARPNDGLMRAHYADCLDWTERREEVDVALQRAVDATPVEWECWAIRARFLFGESNYLLFGSVTKDFRTDFGQVREKKAVLRQRVLSGKITDKMLSDAKKLCEEGSRCLDRATVVAPKEPRLAILQAALTIRRYYVDFATMLRSGHVDAEIEDSFRKTEITALRRAATLAPGNVRIVGFTAFKEVMAAGFRLNSSGVQSDDLRVGVHRTADNQSAESPALAGMRPQGLNMLPGLSTESLAGIRRTIGRLQQVAAGENRRDAADAAELLGLISALFDEPTGAEEYLDLALKRDPALEQAWYLRIALAAWSNDQLKVISLCQDRLRHKDCAKIRCVLARALDEAHRPDEARKVLEEAVLRYPDDIQCTVGLATLLLRPDDPSDLKRAGQLLDHSLATLRKDFTPDRPLSDKKIFQDFLVPRFGYLALTGQFDEICTVLEGVKAQDCMDDRLKELLRILGPSLLLPPVPGVGSSKTMSTP